MNNHKIDRFQYFKYILIFILSFVGFVLINNINVNAATPTETKVTNKFQASFDITKNGCNTWIKDGASCTVTVKATRSDNSCASRFASVNVTFTSGGTKKITGSFGLSNIGTSSNSCRFSADVTTYNRDNEPPIWGSRTVTLSGTTCSKTSLTAYPYNGRNPSASGYSVTCLGNVTVKNTTLSDAKSGVSSSTVSKTCSTGGWCRIAGKDKAGNSSDDVESNPEKRPLQIYIDKDTTKCSSTTISITSGTQYHGYYKGTVTCTAKCTKDNLKVGSAKTGTTTGTTCKADACDAAGNCTTKSISVKRDTTAPTCEKSGIQSEGLSNGYRLGKVTVTWVGKDSQSLMPNGSSSQTYTSSTNDNSVTSLSYTVKDRIGNSKTCPSHTWSRDNTAPSACSYSQSSFSNSSITATAWCTSDGESGCSATKHTKTYTSNGTFSGANGINVYDLTENYSANPKNYKQCSITINRIDKAAPTCTAKISVANPVLSSDGKTWTTNTWHNNSANIYDENGNATANSKYRVQATLASSSDNASTGGVASGIKSGFVAGATLNGEAQTTLSEGSQNGIYTVFVRDNVVNTVTNSKSGWSSPYLYAHGVTTTGNVGQCSANVYSFDNTNPVAHVQLLSKTLNGNYSVWSSSNTPQNSAGTVNNNQNSATFWSSVDITVQYWGTDPTGGTAFTGNTYNGRSGIKRLCYRMVNPNVNSGTTTAWKCENIADQQDGNASTASRYRTMTVPAATYSGITTVYVKVQDWAGNWSSEVSQKVYIDTSKPKAIADTTSSKSGFTETTNGQNYNSMKNPIYQAEIVDRPWVNTPVTSIFKGTDNENNQYAGTYQFGYLWTNTEYTDAQLNSATWYYFNNTDKTAGITEGSKSFTLPGVTNPLRTEYHYLYVRVCDNVKIGPRNCNIFKSKLIRYDNDKPRIDNILDITNNEADANALSVTNGHEWTNQIKVKITTHDEPIDARRAQVAYIKFKWNTNNDTNTSDKTEAKFDANENAYPNSSTATSSLSESGWTYVKCTNEDTDANYCMATIDFNKFLNGSSPVKEGWRFLRIGIVDKAGNVSGDNGIVFGPFKFDITPPEITGLEFRGYRADTKGDVNGDGVINKDDADMVLDYCLSVVNLTDEQFYRADLNNDGQVTSLDAQLIMELPNYQK